MFSSLSEIKRNSVSSTEKGSYKIWAGELKGSNSFFKVIDPSRDTYYLWAKICYENLLEEKWHKFLPKIKNIWEIENGFQFIEIEKLEPLKSTNYVEDMDFFDVCELISTGQMVDVFEDKDFESFLMFMK